MSVMVLQGPKFIPQKSRPLESGHRRYGVRLAIKYSYKLGQKMNLNFSANMAGFCRDSHIYQANPSCPCYKYYIYSDDLNT